MAAATDGGGAPFISAAYPPPPPPQQQQQQQPVATSDAEGDATAEAAAQQASAVGRTARGRAWGCSVREPREADEATDAALTCVECREGRRRTPPGGRRWTLRRWRWRRPRCERLISGRGHLARFVLLVSAEVGEPVLSRSVGWRRSAALPRAERSALPGRGSHSIYGVLNHSALVYVYANVICRVPPSGDTPSIRAKEKGSSKFGIS
jgi:hypothetical protein